MIRKRVRATVHGAISIVNALATCSGSALGISLRVIAEADLRAGEGIRSQTVNEKLIRNIVYNTIPKEILAENSVCISVKSEIPMGFGLKSSSAVSDAVALACSKLVNEDVEDYVVLDRAILASLDAGVTITGAYDDSSACYFGGFVVTNNRTHELIHHQEAPHNLTAIIFIPKVTRRANMSKVDIMSGLFGEALKLARAGEYWEAMNLNGMLLSTCLSTEYEPVMKALQGGALAASISGNGPATAAVSNEEHIEVIKAAFAKFNGSVIVSKINNEKAMAETIIG
ncbi:MAG TPA: shikimate kinase [Candidatus Nitrosopolaris sp.]|nr:shikimate kinase [Candidatus Nitrosopolaris sp.]